MQQHESGQQRGTILGAVGQPITAVACGGRERAKQEEGGEKWKDGCSRSAAIWGLKDPDAHQLLMLNSESDHCFLVCFEHSCLALLPTIFNRQPCAGPTLTSSLAERESTLMDTILPPFSLLFSLPLGSYHFHCTPSETQCPSSVSKLSFHILPPFRAHTVQQHLPLGLYNLLLLFDIWA